MAGILSLKPEDEKREFIRCKDEIAKGLHGCINKDAVSPDPVTNATIGLSLATFQVNSLSPMYTIRLLLKKVYQRKVAKAKQEQRKQEEEERWQTEKAKEEQGRREEVAEAERRQKEEEERWRAACRVINPPIDDAKRYLDCLGEYDEFIEATLEAIEVYLKKGEDYLDDVRTFDYRWFLKKINNRKEEERRKIAATIAAREYNQRLNKDNTRLKALLCPNRKDHESYFKKQIKDRRYTGQSFAQFLSSEEEQDFDKTIVDISRKELYEIVPSDFRQFIDREMLEVIFPPAFS